MESDEWPTPRLVRHFSFGAAVRAWGFQSLSAEMPLASGPRQRGQSDAWADRIGTIAKRIHFIGVSNSPGFAILNTRSRPDYFGRARGSVVFPYGGRRNSPAARPVTVTCRGPGIAPDSGSAVWGGHGSRGDPLQAVEVRHPPLPGPPVHGGPCLAEARGGRSL